MFYITNGTQTAVTAFLMYISQNTTLLYIGIMNTLLLSYHAFMRQILHHFLYILASFQAEMIENTRHSHILLFLCRFALANLCNISVVTIIIWI